MMVQDRKNQKKEAMVYYENSNDHLREELRKLDLLIQIQVMAFRLASQAPQKAAASQTMYISHEEVDGLLGQTAPVDNNHPAMQEIREQLATFQNQINAKVEGSIERRIFLPLPHLAHLFGLSPFELETVIVCLAPEVHRKYDRLYAYLQDDITRKKPSVDLVLTLLGRTEADRWRARTFFSDSAPLFHHTILQATEDSHNPSGASDLARFLKLDPRILNYLLGNNPLEGRLARVAKLHPPLSSLDRVFVDPEIKRKSAQFVQRHFLDETADRKRLALYLHGPYGVGKRDLALGICGILRCPLLSIDMEILLAEETDWEAILRLAFREGLLRRAPLYLDPIDPLLKEDNKARAFAKKLSKIILEYGWLTFLAGERPWSPKGIFEPAAFHPVRLPLPDVPLREAAWRSGLENRGCGDEVQWAWLLANQFRLTPGQIRDAVETASNRCATEGGEKKVTLADLSMACRSQSNQKLTELAVQIEPRYGWEELVLPESPLARLKEICSQVRYRYRVFGEWGFDRKLSHGKGLTVLFVGPPGTGKTMAAEVIACELQLDLYKIDLSSVVSKYIGETEKNLARLFQEAETSNALLFFDEADALFGKRTEVKDAHDRYANIETSYLLQKMEEYEGVVILATNLRENMDEAFTRRIRFIVEFPFPDEANRLKIWKSHFPKEAPLNNEIDYEFLSKQLQIAGGNIKNIVLNAAFLAAEDGGIIGMDQILRAAKREFEKIGKRWDEKNICKSIGAKGWA